jgi:hypothetical protein
MNPRTGNVTACSLRFGVGCVSPCVCLCVGFVCVCETAVCECALHGHGALFSFLGGERHSCNFHPVSQSKLAGPDSSSRRYRGSHGFFVRRRK